MKLLGEIVRGLLTALLAWAQAQAEKPKALEDANTPEPIRARFAAWLRERLRDKPDGVD